VRLTRRPRPGGLCAYFGRYPPAQHVRCS